MAYPYSTFAAAHADDVGEVIAAAHMNNVETALNDLKTHIGSNASFLTNLTAVLNGTYVPLLPMMLPAPMIRPRLNTPVEIIDSEIDVWDFSHTVDMYVTGSVFFPVAVTTDVSVVWKNAGATSGNVRWQINAVYSFDPDGGTVNSATGTTGAITSVAVANATTSVEEEIISGLVIPAGRMTTFRLLRDHDHGDDTLADSAQLIGLMFREAA